MELGISQEAVMQLTEGKEEVEEMAERVAENLRHECLPLYFYLCSVGRTLSIHLFFCRVSASGARVVQGLWRPGDSMG